jgi:hypothetical protein
MIKVTLNSILYLCLQFSVCNRLRLIVYLKRSFIIDPCSLSKVYYIKGDDIIMIRTAFRGISYKEALGVVENQMYDRDERRTFQDGVAAKAIFGKGVYLLSDMEYAADYAFCHAEAENDLAAILEQELNLEKPIILNQEYGENRLKEDALNWKYPEGYILPSDLNQDPLMQIVLIGKTIKEYIVNYLKCDGIIYHVNEDMTYYVSYFPEQQISNIQIRFVFDINELMKATALNDAWNL